MAVGTNHTQNTTTNSSSMSRQQHQQQHAPPPLTEIVASPESSDEERRTHIEVIARVRPLVVTQESSTSFLSSSSSCASPTKKTTSTTRGGGIPRPGSLRLGGSPSRSYLSRTPQRKGSWNNSTTTTTTASTNSNPTSPQQKQQQQSQKTPDESQESYAWCTTSPQTVAQAPDLENVPGRTDSYTLDHVYGPQQSTRHVYDQSVQSLVHAAMEGYHASVLAYGQTSTGKTHTMTGTAAQPGLIPLAVYECFDYLKRLSQPREYLLRLSYMEVYKEHIRDLLAPTHASAPAPIRLFETAADGLVIKGLKEEVVTHPDQVFELLAQGESRRQVGATQLNAHSSRSHVIVRLWIESRATETSNSQNNNNTTGGMQRSTSSASSSLASSSRLGGNVRVSSLSLVDLAGSESVRLTGNNDRRQEGHYINQSLMTLGKVVYALSETGDATNNNNKKSLQKQHIPYRDSKLTRLLQPSLSGNAQVVIVCCVSPLAQHLEESHNTFKFAIRAKRIPQKATIQDAPDERTLLQSYRDEIEDLKRQLKDAQKQPTPSTPSSASPKTLTTASSTLTEDVVSEDEIQELVSSIQTMEKLILKSKPTTSPHIHHRPEDLIDAPDYWDQDDDGADDEEDLIALATTQSDTSASVGGTASLQTPVREPPDDTDKNLEIELARIQGLLGSVLKKRKQQSSSGTSANMSSSGRLLNGAFSSSLASASSDREVLQLRAQLEQQEFATSIRKADSSFLQKQLDEKDDLLLEVSKILEAVEQRQGQLEKENAALRMELAALKSNDVHFHSTLQPE